MKLYGGKRSLPRSSPGEPRLGVEAAPRRRISNDWRRAVRFAHGCIFARCYGRNSSEGTEGPGCGFRFGVSSRCPGSQPARPWGRLVQQATLTVAVGFSLPSRSAEAPTRLETRAKESNMYTSRWVD